MESNRVAKMLVLLLCAGGGAFSLYYGLAMLMVPAFPREADFIRFRMLYSVLPIGGAIALFIVAAVQWMSIRKVRFVKALASVLTLSVGLVIVVFIVLAFG